MSFVLFQSRFCRFGWVGAHATLVHVAVFVGLVEYASQRPVNASIPAFILATLFSYSANRTLTFQVHGAHRAQLPKYALVALAGLGLNILITYLMVDVLSYGYGAALALVVLTVFCEPLRSGQCLPRTGRRRAVSKPSKEITL
jgi:putative flippase GtrA